MHHSIKEVDIENFIWDKLSSADGWEDMSSRGLHFTGVAYRQFNFPGCGIPDLLTISVKRNRTHNTTTVYIRIFELKKGNVVMDHYGQISRYVNHIQVNGCQILSELGFICQNKPIEIVVYGYLVGASFDRDVVWSAYAQSIELYKFKYSLDKGIVFEWIDPYEHICMESIEKSAYSCVNFKRVIRASYPISYRIDSGFSEVTEHEQPGESTSDEETENQPMF